MTTGKYILKFFLRCFIAVLAIAITILSVVILGGNICLSDGCCYKTVEEIQSAQKLLLSLSHLWCILFMLMLVFIFYQFRREKWGKNAIVPKRS
jgi:hypothetical protein